MTQNFGDAQENHARHRPLRVLGGDRRGHRGSGTLLGLAVIGATFALVLSYLPLATVLIARGYAGGAADAAALAGADAAIGLTAGTPCLVAASVAAANHAVLVKCRAESSTVTVAVSVRAGAFSISSRATAGQPTVADR